MLGVTGAILDGLDALDRRYGDVFGSVPVSSVRGPDAYGRLAAAGLTPHHFVAVRPGGRDRLASRALRRRVDADEWRLDLDGDRVYVTSLQPRATTFDRAPTAVRGALVDGGIVPVRPTERGSR